MMKVISLIQKFDNFILLFIKDNLRSPIMDKLMLLFTSLGNLGVIWIMIALLLIINKRYRKVGFMALSALMLSTILGEGILKHLARRVRPSANIPAIDLLIKGPLSYSFPSGHTMSSFAVVGVLAKEFKKYALGFFTLASLIAFSRLYLYVHYPTDVLVGMVLGLICSLITVWIFDKIRI